MGIIIYAHDIVLVVKMEPKNKKLVKSSVNFELGAEKWLFRTTFGPNFLKMSDTDSSDRLLMRLRWFRPTSRTIFCSSLQKAKNDLLSFIKIIFVLWCSGHTKYIFAFLLLPALILWLFVSQKIRIFTSLISNSHQNFDWCIDGVDTWSCNTLMPFWG